MKSTSSPPSQSIKKPGSDGFHYLVTFFSEVGSIFQFTLNFFRVFIRSKFEFNEILKQCYDIGYRSLGLVGITAFIIGMVFTIQSRPTLVEFGAESWLPSMVGISIVREIGPVITALVCAGKIGSSIGAELGSMKVTEQIDAMEVGGINPFSFIVVTRIIACTLMVPLLVIYADLISLYGCYLGVNIKGYISLKLFYSEVFRHLTYGDFIPSIIKSFLFGAAIGIVGCFNGYNSTKGTAGVGKAANSAVVVASLSVFIIDLIVAQISDILNII